MADKLQEAFPTRGRLRKQQFAEKEEEKDQIRESHKDRKSWQLK